MRVGKQAGPTMSKEITIQHPPAGKSITSRSFVAYGEASEVADVRGVLKDPTQRIIGEGRTLQRPPRWIIFFSGIDVLPGNYVLEVIEADVNIPLTVVRSLDFPGPARKGIAIDFPTDGEMIDCTQFVAYGTTDQNLRVRATLRVPTPSGLVERSAEQVFGPPESPHWVIAFADLPPARGPATLEVSNTAGDEALRTKLRLPGA
jgi:hypothetical protein